MTTPGGDAPNSLLTQLFGVDPKAASAIADANTARAGAQSLQSQLSYSDTDNPYVNDLENWAGKSHQDIYSGAQSLMPGMLQAYAKTWNDIATNLGGGLFGSNLAVQNALATGAKGQIANAATESAQKFFQQLTQVQEVIIAVGARIRSVADGAEAVKLSVPPPSTASTAPGTAATPGNPLVSQLLGVTAPSAAMAAGRTEDELHQTAIAAMKNNYDPVFAPAGTGVPTFVSVDKPGAGTNPNTANTGPSSTSPGNATNDSTKDNSRNPDNAQQKDPTSTDPSSQQQASNAANQGTSNSSTTPQSVDPSRANSATSTAGYNGGMGSGGGGGLGGLGSGTDSFGSGGAGRSVPGTGNATAAAASANNAAKTASGSGLSSMPGMGGAGARKSEDEEREHKTPDYLIMDREEELIGRLDPASGGALGANFPAAQTQRDSGEGNYR